jgi:aspartate/methionine/tyrosine aminotransferase
MSSTAVKQQIKMSATLAINTKVNHLMANGHQVYHLGFGESRFPVHPRILAAFRQHATERSYLPVAGLPELRSCVADFYTRKLRIEASADRVMIGSGSKCLLFAAFQALEGDIILPSPSWVSYESQAHLSGKQVFWVPTSLAEGYRLTPKRLLAGLKDAREAGQSPTLLVLNTPNNPSGVMYPAELLSDLADVARSQGLIVVSDEIYALTAYGDVPHASMANYYPEGTIITGGLSKHLSLGGWRVGVAILPSGELGRDLLNTMMAVASTIWTTAASPAQYAALLAFSDDPDIEAYVTACATIHGYVTGYLFEQLSSVGIPCARPTGGFYIYPSFAPWRETLAKKHNIRNSQDLADFLLDEEHMATLPGSDFGADPADLTLRLSTSYLYALTDEDAERMLALYQTNPKRDQFLQEACPKVVEVGQRFKIFVDSLA